jgi:phenylpropionate dioxygenase-like ring-hydroxylating dioxygenase large terminal subunit
MPHSSFDYRTGVIINDDAPPGHPDAKAPYVDNGTDIVPVERYYSPAAMEREWTHLWRRVWNYAGRVSDAAQVGDFFTYKLGREHFLIVRSAPNTLQAFHNVCQHRGNLLVHKEIGSSREFVCGFHSWTYGLDGSLKRITDEETFRPEVICDRPRLAEVRCETWAGFVFINIDPQAPPLREFLGVLPDHFAAYQLESWQIQSDTEMQWGANWKTAIDAFIEAYHSHRVHFELNDMLEEKEVQYDCYPNGHNRMIVPWGVVSSRDPTPEKLPAMLEHLLREFECDPSEHEGSTRDIRATLLDAKRRWGKKYGLDMSRYTDAQVLNLGSYHVFPNWTINILPETCLLQRWRPHATDPERLTYDVVTLLPPVSGGRLRTLAAAGRDDNVIQAPTKYTRPQRQYVDDARELGHVINQDFYAVPKIQEGLRSSGFKGMRFGEQEVRCRHYLKEVDRYLAGLK